MLTWIFRDVLDDNEVTVTLALTAHDVVDGANMHPSPLLTAEDFSDTNFARAEIARPKNAGDRISLSERHSQAGRRIGTIAAPIHAVVRCEGTYVAPHLE